MSPSSSLTTKQQHDGTPLRRYFSRRETLAKHLPNLPTAPDFIGHFSPLGIFWNALFLIVPLSYVYISLVLLRELSRISPDYVYEPLNRYLPYLARLVDHMNNSSRLVEVWCWIEGIFYIALKLYISWLQRKDPLEASLSAAPMMDLDDRTMLWRRMMEAEADDVVGFLTGWFLDADVNEISKYDVRDFAAWSMYEGRHQEHLTTKELEQLESFVSEMEYRISLQLYGAENGETEEREDGDDGESSVTTFASGDVPAWKKDLPTPKKFFQFTEQVKEQPNFFSDLFETYRRRYDEMMSNSDFHPFQDMRDMVSEFHPVQNVKNLVAETRQTIAEAEDAAMAKAAEVYETLVPQGSEMDRRLSAVSNATYAQLTEAWNSVKNMKERLETAQYLSKQRDRIRKQLKSYNVMLNRMREMSSAVPAKQMAAMMRKISECNHALDSLEKRAQTAFESMTGFARKNLPAFLQTQQQPKYYLMYSSDPLLGIKTYPLAFHLFVLGCSEIPLRVLMARRGFERRTVGPISYYAHPGLDAQDDIDLSSDDDDDDDSKTPIIFVHGIGLGLIMYIPLIDRLLETGRPILLPEIPYVSGFRPFQSPTSVLSPASVASTMTAMLATHGHLRGTWVGHSYGTSWLSYMIKYAPHAVSAVCFLDPICFCLHVPVLTKQFVYMQPDPGTVSYIVRTDVVVNWTIQRSFPWSWIDLFYEQIGVPCSVFLSEKDALVPAVKVGEYLKRKEVPMCDFSKVTEEHFESRFNCTMFRGEGHGDWVDHPSDTVPTIVQSVESLCRRAEDEQRRKKEGS